MKSRPLAKQDYVNAVTQWVDNRRLEKSLSREELGKLKAGDRLVALWRAQLEGVARYLRTNPKADATIAVYIGIVALADNNQGFCDLAQDRFARWIGRSRKTINECIDMLEGLGLVRVKPVKGWPSEIEPIIGRIFALKGQTIWLFDAMAPYIQSQPGRKKKEIPVTAAVTTISEAYSKYLSPKSEIPVTAAVTQFSYESPSADQEGGSYSRRGTTARKNGEKSEVQL